MLQIVTAIFSMVGKKDDMKDADPKEKVEKIFSLMDTVSLLDRVVSHSLDYDRPYDPFFLEMKHIIQDNNGELSKEEFLEGARQDKTIVQALSLYDGMV